MMRSNAVHYLWIDRIHETAPHRARSVPDDEEDSDGDEQPDNGVGQRKAEEQILRPVQPGRLIDPSP